MVQGPHRTRSALDASILQVLQCQKVPCRTRQMSARQRSTQDLGSLRWSGRSARQISKVDWAVHGRSARCGPIQSAQTCPLRRPGLLGSGDNPSPGFRALAGRDRAARSGCCLLIGEELAYTTSWIAASWSPDLPSASSWAVGIGR